MKSLWSSGQEFFPILNPLDDILGVPFILLSVAAFGIANAGHCQPVDHVVYTCLIYRDVFLPDLPHDLRCNLFGDSSRPPQRKDVVLIPDDRHEMVGP